MYSYSLILLSFLATSVFGQSKSHSKKALPPIELTRISSSKYSLKQRQSIYPFNLATRIKLVSFDKRVKDKIQRLDTGGQNNSKKTMNIGDYVYGLPIDSDTICFSKVYQIITLNQKEIDSLTNISYNECSRWTITETSKEGCYYPHNAIIYFDKNDRPFEYIELCFDCHQVKYSSENIIKFQDCDIALEGLKNFFKLLGLKTSEEEFKVN